MQYLCDKKEKVRPTSPASTLAADVTKEKTIL